MVDDFWDLEYILYNVYAHISNSYLTTILVVYLFARNCATVDIGVIAKTWGCPISSLQRLF